MCNQFSFPIPHRNWIHSLGFSHFLILLQSNKT